MDHHKEEVISVIVPVYNAEHYLEECILSILHQTYHALQIILIDDGSTDHSGLICERFAGNRQSNNGNSSGKCWSKCCKECRYAKSNWKIHHIYGFR